MWQADSGPGGAYPYPMSLTPLMLSALATSAVPGFQAVSAHRITNSQRDSALVHDVNGNTWMVELPTSDAEHGRFEARLDALRALGEGLRSRLPFQVAKVQGTTAVQGRTLAVTDYIPGNIPAAKQITPDVAGSIARALSAIHELPSATVIEAHRPAVTSLDELREAAHVVDRAAASGLLPQSLLRRWEAACEDRGLWHFESSVIHGQMQLGRFVLEGNQVVGVTGWRQFRVADPARDIAWLTTPASQAFATPVITEYRSARPGVDRWFLQRARFWAELDVARWLLHGIDTRSESITQDASGMLQALNDRVAGDLEAAITQPITQPAAAARS